MKEPADYAELAAAVLARRKPPEREGTPNRDRGIAAVALAIEANARRRKQRRALAAVACVAAAALAVLLGQRAIGGWHTSAADCTSCPSTPAFSDRVGLGDGVHYAPGSRLKTTESALTVRFGATTSIELSSRTDLEYRQGDAQRRFRLLRGDVRLHVAKLAPNERFVVETDDAEIEVRGTRFSVAIVPGNETCAPHTLVEVGEGVVEVRSALGAVQVTDGGEWRGRACERASASANDASSAARAVARAPTLVRPRASSARPIPSLAPAVPSVARPTGPLPGSALEAQNRLYARAVAAGQAKRDEEAAALFGQLIREYPAGPLLETAAVEQMRALGRLTPARRSAAARSYLERFPNGYARSEAESWLKQQ